MAFKLNTAEGQSSGTTLTVGNSGGGSGDALDQVVTAGSGAVTYSNEQALFGTQSYKITSTTASAVYLMYDPATSMNAAAQMGIYLTGYPDVNQAVVFLRTAGGAASVGALSITSTGAVRLTNAVGSTVNTSSAGVVSLNTWIRLDLCISVGATTSTGRFQASASERNSSTTLWSHDSGFTSNAGTSAIGNFRFGKLDTTPVMATLYVDDLTVDTTAETPIPPRSLATGAWFTA